MMGPELQPSWDFEWELVRIYNRDRIEAVVVDGALVMARGRARAWDDEVFLRESLPVAIKTVEGANDYAMLQEVLRRRFKHGENAGENWNIMPDLVLIDGGKGQLSSAVEVLERLGIRDQPIIGLAKRLEEVFLPGKSEPELIARTSAGLRLLPKYLL
jgi:excinuclease UvrABC nuclease subunit